MDAFFDPSAIGDFDRDLWIPLPLVEEPFLLFGSEAAALA